MRLFIDAGSGSALTMPFVLVREEMRYSYELLQCLFVCLLLTSNNFMLHHCKTKLFQPLLTSDLLGWISDSSDDTRK